MMQHLVGSPFRYRNVFGNRKVDISEVRTSLAVSACPITVVVSPRAGGNRALKKVLTSTRMKRQQLPSALSAKRYVPLFRIMLRPVLTAGASRVCQESSEA